MANGRGRSGRESLPPTPDGALNQSMGDVMTWVVSILGIAAVMFVITDMFHTLANPGALGWLGRSLLNLAWRMSRRNRLAGPLAMLAVVVAWGVIAVLGWAAIYWPHMDRGFSFAAPHGGSSDVVNAVYVSLVTISTLGLGDVFPTSGWLRLLNPLEALFGFALLTVAVSWVMQVFPALTRRRELALHLTHLETAGAAELLDSLSGVVAHGVLQDLATEVTGVRIDLHDYPETYYFREAERVSSLPLALETASNLARVASDSSDPQVRLGGALLRAALDDLAGVLDRRFLHRGGSPAEILAAYGWDHRGRSGDEE